MVDDVNVRVCSHLQIPNKVTCRYLSFSCWGSDLAHLAPQCSIQIRKLGFARMLPIVSQFVHSASRISWNVGLDMTFVKDIAGKRVLGALETTGVCFGSRNR